MSTVQEITQAQNTTASSTTTSQSSMDIMGKQDFLTLLVAQLQNQDPLNPDDPTEFTAQLAQFSQLEQMFNMNESMDNLVNSNANSDKFSTLQTIGKNVVYQGSKFEYNGEDSIELGYELDGKATEVTLSIQKNGATIKTVEGVDLSKGQHFISWDGLDEDGNPAGEGSYTLAITAKAAEGESIAASPLLKSEVTGVDLTGEYGGKLLTKAGEVSFTSILGVYEVVQDPEETMEEAVASGSYMIEPRKTNNGVAVEASQNADTLQIKDDGQISFTSKLF